MFIVETTPLAPMPMLPRGGRSVFPDTRKPNHLRILVGNVPCIL